jgi:hypothetical protein
VSCADPEVIEQTNVSERRDTSDKLHLSGLRMTARGRDGFLPREKSRATLPSPSRSIDGDGKSCS